MIIRFIFGYVVLIALWRTNRGQDTPAGPPPTAIPGQPTNCAGFDYNSGSKTCNIYANVDQNALQSDPGTDFYQKSCVQTANSTAEHFSIIWLSAQIYRVAGTDAVLSKSTMHKHGVFSMILAFPILIEKLSVFLQYNVFYEAKIANQRQCLDSYTNFGFECQSAMYYPADQSCILNTESRYKRPDLFTDETKDQMTYFDNNCAGATCAASYVVQYTKTADIIPQNLDGIKVQSSTLSNCQALCTDNIGKPGGSGVNCKAFTFSNGDKTCTLYNDRIVPLGRANFTDGAGTDYFEKGCYKAQETCRNIPAFTRVPQKVLVGFAAFVLDGVPSVSQCLDACLKPPDSIASQNPSFKCMSAMYYYNEQECILNTETRQTKPDLMQNELLKEDYFDIMCLGGQEMCPEGTQLTSIRFKDSKVVPVNQTNVLKQAGGSPQDCLKQ
uniref:Apple domain-containing protein n=1 Tax=Romanomermis culicivorax TaxID=13658 RepID=A0A915I1U9_ROMCU